MSKLYKGAIISIFLFLSIISAPSYRTTHAAPPPSVATIGIWSNVCRSSNITISNPSCGGLAVGTSFSVQLNITNVASWNAFDLFLYYDPHFLNATGFSSNQTVFTNAFPIVSDFEPGKLHLAMSNLGSPINGGGTITHLFFKIIGTGVSPLTLAAGSLVPSNLAVSWTRIALGSTPLDVTTSNGYFKNAVGKLGPIASFSTKPTAPVASELVTFNATNSFDPDVSQSARPGIRFYTWDFGDGYSIVDDNRSVVTHYYSSAAVGNFSVRLTIADLDDGFWGMLTTRISIGQARFHSIEVFVNASQTTQTIAKVGTLMRFNVTVSNTGAFPETFNLTLGYRPPSNYTVFGSLTGLALSPGLSTSFVFPLNTSGLPPSPYYIEATVFDPLIPLGYAVSVPELIILQSRLSPLASFTYLPVNPSVGDIVNFNGTSSHSPNGAINTWNWIWGDGLSDSYGGATPWHIYEKPGTYTIKLTVTDATANTASYNSTITVTSIPGTTPHSPIIFNGNHGFTLANGVSGGSGTLSDPYIIEGWQIDSSSSNGIAINGTSAYFVIRHVVITFSNPASSYCLCYDNVHLTNVVNGRIEGSIISANSLSAPGISIENSSHVTVSNISFTGRQVAIYGAYSNNLTINDNIMLRTVDGVSLRYSTDVEISRNEVSNAQWGLFSHQSSHIDASSNNLSQNFYGIVALGSTYISITGNNISSNMGDGIFLEPTPSGPRLPPRSLTGFVVISGNNIAGNGFNKVASAAGIDLFSAGNLTIYRNNLVNNALQVNIQGEMTNSPISWDDGYPGGGNYWSDYEGTDNCAGPQQTICGVPDGIGDTPYTVDAHNDAVDHYPLIKPITTTPDTTSPAWQSTSALSVSKLGQTSLTLSWVSATDDDRVIAYRLYQDKVLLATLPGYVYTYNVTGLTPGTSYTFLVQASDVSNNWSTSGPSTSIATQSTPSTPPPQLTTNQPSSFWAQYWYAIVAAVVAVAVISVVAVRLRRQQRSPPSPTIA